MTRHKLTVGMEMCIPDALCTPPDMCRFLTSFVKTIWCLHTERHGRFAWLT